MHVAMIIDEDRLAQEQDLLNRLTIGLLGEGERITRIVPDALDEHTLGPGEQRIALARRLSVPMRVVPWMRKGRIEDLVGALGKPPVDVIYALGTRAWDLGIDLAEALERPLALEVWTARQVRQLNRRRRSALVSGYVVPTAHLAAVLRQRVPDELVSHVPLGVPIPDDARTPFADGDDMPGLTILGPGLDMPAFRAVLSGMSRVFEAFSTPHLFVELRGPHQHDIWRHARRLELLSRISMIEDIGTYRSLVTRSDLLLLPDRSGDVRSLVLEAMAAGTPVMTGDPDTLEMIRDGETGYVVDATDPDAWARRIRHVLGHPDEARAVGQRGRTAITEHHRSSNHCALLIATFEAICSGGAYPFAQPS